MYALALRYKNLYFSIFYWEGIKMHKKMTKSLVSSVMAAAMMASSFSAVLAPIATKAAGGEEQLLATDFDDGVGLPWHTCETNPAKQTFEIKDGKYIVTIKNPNGSAGRWDLQLRYRGLQLVDGHKYHVHAEIEPSAAGYIYSKIGDYSGDNEYWNDTGKGNWQVAELKAGEKFVIDTDFTAGQGPKPLQPGPAEWAFHYANNNGKYGNNDTGMPKDSTLTFDNMSLVDLDATEPVDRTNEFGVVRPKSNVRLNQVGYYENLTKKASYVSDAADPLEFDVFDKSGTSVFNGTSTVISGDEDSGTPETKEVMSDGEKATKYKDSGKYVHILDFSKLTTGGTGYYIVVKDKVGVSDTQSGTTKNAFDTKIDGDKVMWTNWKTGKSYQMNKSHPFAISNTLYDGLLRDSMSYFYQNRSGVPIEAEYIKNGDASALSHKDYGHNPDKAYVQSKWVKAYEGEFNGDKTYDITATYGWYDAGDHGKYVVNGGVSVWTLQNMYEMSKHIGKEDKWADNKSMLIPQDENNAKGAPDALDEARIELQWFFDMMVKSDDPYFGKDAGMVYHKLHDHKWTGLAIHAWKYEGFKDMERIVKPPTYAATFNMVACAAQAARLWKGIDDKFADECLENAKIGLAAAEKNKDKWYNVNGVSEQQDDMKGTNAIKGDVYFAPLDQAIGGGPYGDTYVTDDYYWALCELFATTGDKDYYDKLMEYKNANDSTGADKALSLTSNLGGGENKGSFSSFNWGCTSGLGTLSLYLNQDKLSEADAKTVTDSIVAAADAYIEEENKQGMGIPYHGSTFTDDINIGKDKNGNSIEVSGYEWGSNSFVANNAIVMSYAYDATKKNKYINGASTAMDYIFGRNGNDFSYVSGYGDTEMETTLRYPHHRLWAHGVDPDFPMAPAGVMSGGPGAGMQDPYIGGLGYKRGTLASQKCYVDSAEAWSVNEITINWNSPLAWMVSYLEDVAPTVKADGSTDPDPIETKPAETTKTPDGTTLWGDANVDGKVTIADATAILQSIANADKYALKPQGKINADVVDNGDGPTPKDALALQMMDAKLLDQTDFPTTSAKLDALKK
jgi:endoglucanase